MSFKIGLEGFSSICERTGSAFTEKEPSVAGLKVALSPTLLMFYREMVYPYCLLRRNKVFTAVHSAALAEQC
jgi:hypothetical protein